MTESRVIGQRVIRAGMALSLMCLAYFYMLDRILFSSKGLPADFPVSAGAGFEGGMDRIGDLRFGGLVE